MQALLQAGHFNTIFPNECVYQGVYLTNLVIRIAVRPGRIITGIAANDTCPKANFFRNMPRYTEALRQILARITKSREALFQTKRCIPIFQTPLFNSF